MSDTTFTSELTSALQQLAPIFQADCDERNLPGCAYGPRPAGGWLVAGARWQAAGALASSHPAVRTHRTPTRYIASPL